MKIIISKNKVILMRSNQMANLADAGGIPSITGLIP
jgi:hypothetical protein